MTTGAAEIQTSAAPTIFPMIAMPLIGNVPSPTMHSLFRSQTAAFQRGIEFSFNTWDGCSLVHKARNCLVSEFLNSDCTHFFQIDGDLSWDAETFIKFCILGAKHDVLCGAYPKKDDKACFFMAPLEQRIVANEYGCVELKQIATGFSITQRRVIEALAEKAPKIRFDHDGPKKPRVFRCDIDDEEERGEDMAFCADVRDAGFQIWLDPNVTIGHVGQKTFRHKIIDQMTRVDATHV